MKSLYEKNFEKIKELLPEKQWAAEMWLNDCYKLGFEFRISEAYRTQERQDQLYAQGRTKPGPIVTHTRSSKHTKRLAVDVYPINCGYADLEDVAERYKISHPFVRGSFLDLPHFEFDNAMEKPVPKRPASPHVEMRRLQREIDDETSPSRKLRLQARLQQLKRVHAIQ